MNRRDIIEKLLAILSAAFGTDGVYKEMLIGQEVKNEHEISLYYLVIKGERDQDTPFYCGSTTTHICREDPLDGKVVWAEIIATESEGGL